MAKQETNVVKNTAMLYLMNIAKLIFPLITLPYLTRVLSVETYGAVSYVKAVMIYMQVLVDFGFILSATKEVVELSGDRRAISEVAGNTVAAKMLLSVVALAALLSMSATIELLRANLAYALLSLLNVALSSFLLDFLFRGLERMEVITLRFVVMKSISTALTFVFVKSDVDILWIPCLDIISSAIAIGLIGHEMRKMGVGLRVTGWRKVWLCIRASYTYFISTAAATAFGALNTLLIGIFLPARDVAYWGLCIQMVTAVQNMYTPLIDGIYPEMIRSKNLKLVRRVLLIFLPIIFAGCAFTFAFAPHILRIVGGSQYVVAADLLRAFTFLMFVSFPTILFGWPVLGAIGKARTTSMTTVATAVLQVGCLGLLAMIGQFKLINLALLRGLTDAAMLGMRLYFMAKYRREFAVKEAEKS